MWTPRRIKIVATAAPLALTAALSSTFALDTLERLEGNVLTVYADKHAQGIPTYCAGRTEKGAPIGARLAADDCREINKTTLLAYGHGVLNCTEWKYLTPTRLIGLTMFAINVGVPAACGSVSFKYLNKGRIEEACNLLHTRPDGKPNWSYADGVYVQGLQNRRKAESVLCLD